MRDLQDAGYAVASADDVARRLLESRSVRHGVARAAHLPEDFTRDQLRDTLFADVGRRRAVNAVLHPLIVEGLAASGAEFVEIPLLIEAGLQGCFDEVWVVTCGPAEQRRRLSARVEDPHLARLILGLQLPTRVKLAFADVVVRTNRPLHRVRMYALEAASKGITQGVAKRAK